MERTPNRVPGPPTKMKTLLISILSLALYGVVVSESIADLLEAYARVERGNMFKRTPSSCSGKWEELKDSSTMCLFEDDPSAKNCGVTEEDKKVILATHNRLRANVNPSQKGMMKMYWNEDLAVVAQKWAKQCRLEHDTNDNRQVPGWGQEMFVGQSWAGGAIYDTWEKAVEKAWYGEVEFFNYGSEFHNGVVGHFTQAVRDQANLVGCGQCTCPQGPFHVCNYYRGNSQDSGHPYFDGTPCSECKTCVDKLCDCGDKLCKNNGTLNSKTCECDCVGKWKGDDCGTYDCPDYDADFCGEGKHFDPPKCKQYFNVPKNCPYMCGLCKGGKGKGQTCKDLDEKCPMWAAWGHCDKEGGYTQIKCKKSCNICEGGSDEPKPCEDTNKGCADWASRGECENNPSYMKSSCRKSCKEC